MQRNFFDTRYLWFFVVLLSAATPLFADQKPNVVMIAIDDLNDWVGFLGGHPQVKTPHMDRLASQGTAFTNAHCQSPLCNPSRTSLMTGLRPSTTGIYGLAPWFRQLDQFTELVTLPQHFSRHGYRTYSGGKIYHYPRSHTKNEFHVHGPGVSIGVGPGRKLVDTPSDHPLVDWGTFPHRDEQKGDYKVASWAVEQLDARPTEPFFLSVGFFLPHVPCFASKKWFDLYPEQSLILPLVRRDDREDTPRFSWYLHWKLPEPRLRFLEEANQWKNLVRSYLACVSFVDSQVGRVLDALEKNDLVENTIVVLWSDHGFHLGEKLITGKNTLWERSTRVPLVFAGPGITSGARCSRPAELLDIYPTLVELCATPPNPPLPRGGWAGLEGVSLVAQLKDASAARSRPAITTHNHDNHAVRSEHWRYIRYADGSEELYNMQKDRNEWQNLAAEARHAEVIQQHRRWLPKINARPARGSAARILTYENGKATWEGADIKPDVKIPEL